MKKVKIAVLIIISVAIAGMYIANKSAAKSYNCSFTVDNIRIEDNSITYSTIDNGYGYVSENSDCELTDAVKGVDELVEEYEVKSLNDIPQTYKDESYNIIKNLISNEASYCSLTNAIVNANNSTYNVCIDGKKVEISMHHINQANSQDVTKWYTSEFTNIQNYVSNNNAWLYGMTTDYYNNSFYIAASHTDNYFITVKISSDNESEVKKIMNALCKI